MPIKYWLCVASVFVSATCYAHVRFQATDHFTSSQLVTDLRGTPGTPKADQVPVILYKQRHAEGYLAGVMDATDGEMWCRPVEVKPGELEELVWTALERSPQKGDRSAAKEVIQILRSMFPCSKRKP